MKWVLSTLRLVKLSQEVAFMFFLMNYFLSYPFAQIKCYENGKYTYFEIDHFSVNIKKRFLNVSAFNLTLASMNCALNPIKI